jgi:hypothetical protein
VQSGNDALNPYLLQVRQGDIVVFSKPAPSFFHADKVINIF